MPTRFIISQHKHPSSRGVYSDHMANYLDTKEHKSRASIAHISSTKLTALCDITIPSLYLKSVNLFVWEINGKDRNI